MKGIINQDLLNYSWYGPVTINQQNCESILQPLKTFNHTKFEEIYGSFPSLWNWEWHASKHQVEKVSLELSGYLLLELLQIKTS